MNIFLNYSELIACISFLIPLSLGWIFYCKVSFNLRYFLVILTISFVFAVIGYYTGKYYINNLLIYFINYVVQFYLYSILFLRILTTRFSKRFIPVMMILFAVIIVLNFRTILDTTNFDSYTPAFLSVTMLFYCILFFNEQLNRPYITFIYKTPWFWIMTGLLLYFAGSFFILLTTNYLMFRNENFISSLWNLKEIFNIMKNLLVALGFVFIKDNGWNRSF